MISHSLNKLFLFDRICISGFKWVFIVLFLSFIQIESNAKIKVYFVKGNVQYEKIESSIHSLKIGMEIQPNTKVILHPNSEVIFKNDNNKVLILKATKTINQHSYTQIIAQFDKTDNKGLMSAIFSFLGTQLSKENYDIRDYADSNMRSWGGVVRSHCSSGIMLKPGDGAKVINGDILFKWQSDLDNNDYYLEVYKGLHYSEQAELVFKKLVKGNYSLVNEIEINKWRTNADSLFNWIVYPVGQRPGCSRFALFLVDYYLTEEFLNALNTHLESIDNFRDRQLFSAFYYEAHHLLEESDNIYRQLIAQYNDNMHKDLYKLFLARNGMVSRYEH